MGTADSVFHQSLPNQGIYRTQPRKGSNSDCTAYLFQTEILPYHPEAHSDQFLKNTDRQFEKIVSLDAAYHFSSRLGIFAECPSEAEPWGAYLFF